MTDKSLTATTTAAASNTQTQTDDQKKGLKTRELLATERGKWSEVSEQELSNLKNKDDLAVQVSAKYGHREG
jgi:hypothetical protein